MVQAHHPSDIFLHPGEFFFGTHGGRITTLLGSCVAITFWHPTRKVGGMCHYLLPGRRRELGSTARELDGRYADEAIEMFRRAILAEDTEPHDYHVKMFGGGTQFADDRRHNGMDVPGRNIETGLRLLSELGLEVVARHLGGVGARSVMLDLDSGEVWLRHAEAMHGGVQ
jgi:chemotaxis protein CheD